MNELSEPTAMESWFGCSRSAARGQHVKLVFPGGHVELLDHPTLAAEVMARHPRFCVARPDVFREPVGAVTAPDTVLQLGHKYYVVPSSTVRRLLKYSSSGRSPGRRGGVTLRAHLTSEKGYKVGGRRWFRCLVAGEAKAQRPRRRERESVNRGEKTEMVRELDVKGKEEEDGKAPGGGPPVRRRRRSASPTNSASYSWQPSLHSITEE